MTLNIVYKGIEYEIRENGTALPLTGQPLERGYMSGTKAVEWLADGSPIPFPILNDNQEEQVKHLLDKLKFLRRAKLRHERAVVIDELIESGVGKEEAEKRVDEFISGRDLPMPGVILTPKVKCPVSNGIVVPVKGKCPDCKRDTDEDHK